MIYTLEDKYNLVTNLLLKETSKNPLLIANNIMKQEYIEIHGPIHHYIDSASFLVAFKNSGGNINIPEALEELKTRTIKMPGAMCGLWGVCGSVTALGASLSIIDKTSPLSNDINYKDHMKYTSSVIAKMSEIGGPRCCKRNAYISIGNIIEHVNTKYNLNMEYTSIKCEFSSKNSQCIGSNCPYFNNK